MKLFTNQQYQQLIENGSPQNRGKDHLPVVHLTIPGTNWEWLLSEIVTSDCNTAFGLYDTDGIFPEVGYINLQQIIAAKAPLWGTGVYVNPFFEAKYPMSAYVRAANICGRIVRKDGLLRKLHAMELVKQSLLKQ